MDMVNKRKAEYERKRVINLIRPSNRKRNCLVFYANESCHHANKKFIIFFGLLKKHYEIYSECIFLPGNRADLLAIKDGKSYIIEVLESESKEHCIKKLEQYPHFTGSFIIKDFNDIDEMLKEL